MKLSHRLLRCHRGRKDKMVPSSKVVEAEVEEVATTHRTVAVEVMNKGVMTEEAEEAMTKEAMTEEAEEGTTHPMEAAEVMNMGVMNEEGEDVVMTMEAEGEEEEASLREAGPTVEEVAIRMSIIEIVITETQAFKLEVITVVAVVTKEVAMVAINPHIPEVDIKVVAATTNKTTDTKMGTPVIEVEAVEEGEVAVEVGVAVVGKEVAGEEEVHRTLIKGGSLSSTSSMEVTSTINLDLDKEDTSRAEATKLSFLDRAHVIEVCYDFSFQISTRSCVGGCFQKMIFAFEHM